MALDLSRIRVPNNFQQLYGNVAVLRMPKGDEDFRVHSSWRLPSVGMVKVAGKPYVVDTDLCPVLAGHLAECELRAAFSSKSGAFVLPIDNSDELLKKAAEMATSKWVRLGWDSSHKTHEIQEADQNHKEPEWPFADFPALLEVALTDRLLAKADDDVVKAVLQKKRKPRKKQAETKDESAE